MTTEDGWNRIGNISHEMSGVESSSFVNRVICNGGFNSLKTSDYHTPQLLENTKIVHSANSECVYLVWFSN
jgi:hypothetical protein